MIEHIVNNKPYKGKVALLVDDSHDYVELIESYLKDLGFSVITGNSYDDGERLIFEEKFDIAFFDLVMEKADNGFVLSYKAKKMYPNIPVIIMSDVSYTDGIRFDNYNKAKCSWIKADEIVEKNLRSEQLRHIVDKYLPL